MSPRADRLFREYAESHRDPVNVAIHKVAVPAILFHIVAMLDWIGTGLSVAGLELTAGVIVTALAAIWYAAVTPGLALAVVPFSILCLWLGRRSSSGRGRGVRPDSIPRSRGALAIRDPVK